MLYNIPSELSQLSGIYIIRNSVNAKVYVGSAKRLKKRFDTHLAAIRKGKHSAPPLQAFINKYGVETLRFELLAVCETTELINQEQKFLDEYKCYHRKHGFNTCATAGSCIGIKHTAATRAKVAAAGIGRKLSPESIAKIRDSQKGIPKSLEVRAKMSKAASKRICSPENRAAQSLARRGKKQSPELIEKRAAAKRGKKLSPEHVAKLRGQKRTDEARANMSRGQLARKNKSQFHLFTGPVHA